MVARARTHPPKTSSSWSTVDRAARIYRTVTQGLVDGDGVIRLDRLLSVPSPVDTTPVPQPAAVRARTDPATIRPSRGHLDGSHERGIFVHLNMAIECLASLTDLREDHPAFQGLVFADGAADPSGLVELRGFEPLTFSLRTRRATNCATAPRSTARRAGSTSQPGADSSTRDRPSRNDGGPAVRRSRPWARRRRPPRPMRSRRRARPARRLPRRAWSGPTTTRCRRRGRWCGTSAAPPACRRTSEG